MSVISNENSVHTNSASLTGKGGVAAFWWAALGAVVLLVIFTTYGQWILSADFKPSPTGSDVMPAWMPGYILALQVLSTGAGLLFVWLFLLRPWITQKQISWDGLFLIVCLSIYLQDPMDNYFNFTFSYNAHMFNMASWAMYLPGWEAPRQNLFAEPLFFMGGVFIWLIFGFSVMGCWWLRKAKEWFPNASNFMHIFMLFIICFIIDLVFESALCRTSIFAYGGTYHPLTLWAGQPYQFPLYESFGIASVAVLVTVIRYYRDDKGQSWAERGLQNTLLPKKTKKLASFLALLGFTHLGVFIVFFLPYTWFALKADSYPKLPSYLTMEICGEGTPYACPSREVPIPSRHSLAIKPDDPRLSPNAKQN